MYYALITLQYHLYREYFPNVIGALDGCHLHIELTEEKVDDLEYRNFHQWYSIILLVRIFNLLFSTFFLHLCQ